MCVPFLCRWVIHLVFGRVGGEVVNVGCASFHTYVNAFLHIVECIITPWRKNKIDHVSWYYINTSVDNLPLLTKHAWRLKTIYYIYLLGTRNLQSVLVHHDTANTCRNINIVVRNVGIFAFILFSFLRLNRVTEIFKRKILSCQPLPLL